MPRRRLRDLSIIQNPLNSEETNSEQQTTIEPFNVLNTADETAEIQSNLKVVGGTKLEEELSSGQKVGRLQLFDITHRKKDGSPITIEAVEIMEKLKDKRAKYEAITSSDSFVNLDDIDNRIITEVLGLERYGRAQAKVQKLRDQMAQMQASTVEQIAQLKAEAQRKYEELQLQFKTEVAAREVEVTRKYDELQLQLQNIMKMFQQSQNRSS
ncbi:Hydrogenase expression/formation hupH [Gossypium arboreum]|uniref:Hydrogenase expression/formation hupH n=1 Tax=Gossypium arboreum TaxID=29729 RepID=A0A0B0MWZ2_GOSAR|nr:Hydrogenase expression/formation hupH [Gossypium arboreum]